MPLRVLTDYHPNPRRAPGILWCGCPASGARLDENNVLVCPPCEQDVTPKPKEKPK